MFNYVLGLDLGPTSVGWAAIEIDQNGNYIGLANIKNNDRMIPALGSRIFPAGIDNLGQGQREEPKNKKRRECRSHRRMLRRQRGRRQKVLSLLRVEGLAPEDNNELLKTQQCNPYELRSRGLEETLELYEIGRIILHMSKRRGFQSNRKTPDKSEDIGKIKEGMERLKNETGGKTLGQFWHDRLKQSPLQAIRNKNNYNWVAERKQYREELNKIWQYQKKYYPERLTDALLNQINTILFNQLPFELTKRKKRKVIGTCSLIKGQPRCPLSKRKAQEFRILQKVSDFMVNDELLSEAKRQKLAEILSVAKERTIPQIRKLLELKETDRINFEYSQNVKIKGNEIDSQLAGSKRFGKKIWQEFIEEDKEEIWQKIQHFLNNSQTPESLTNELKDKYGLTIKDPESLNTITEPVGYLNFSEKALDRLLPYMREGVSLYDAEQKAGFEKKWRKLKRLPLPTRENGFTITNPTIVSVMVQVRKIINALMKELGKPEKIIIELSRELKGNKERRYEIIKEQGYNQKEREEAAKLIREYMNWTDDVDISAVDIAKYRLWHEQKGRSPYSGKTISMTQLLSRETDIDHILPRSMSLDNSMNNKVVCFAGENQEKGQRTPIDWLGGDSIRWERVERAIDHWNPKRDTDDDEISDIKPNENKWKRFSVHGDEIADRYTPERLLRETSYIGREVRSYLKRLYSSAEAEQKVKTSKGGITAELRRFWGLNRIISMDDTKNRDDLRHHAIDAAVIAVTEPVMIKRITQVLQAAGPRKPFRDIHIPQPWENYTDDIDMAIQQLNVSHRVQRKVKGSLHKETFYYKEEHGSLADRYITRKRLDGTLSLKYAEHICDENIKKLVLERLAAYDNNPKKAFIEPIFLPNRKGNPIPIYKVRVWRNFEDGVMINLHDNIFVESDDNHHVEIFKIIENGEEKLIRRICNMYEAAQRIKYKKPIISRKHPDYPEADFVMSLSKGESIELADPKGKRVYARVKLISHGRIDNPSAIYIILWEIDVGKIADKNITSKTQKAYCFQHLRHFINKDVKKILIDPLGRVRWAND